MVKNLNQDQVKSKGEEENKKPGLWKRIKQPLKLLGLIAATIVGFLLGGPIAVLAIGALAYGHYRKSNRTNSTSKPGNESHKSNNNESKEKSKEESKTKSVQPPGFIKKALYRAGAIAVGLMLGGPIGAVIAGIFVAIDIMSNGKVIQGVEKLLDASYGALSWLGKKALGIGKWAVDKIRSSGQGQKAGRGAAGEERETGKEQGTERGVAGKGRGGDNLADGFDNPHYSPPVAQAAKPNENVIKAAETVQQTSPDGQGVNSSATISPEVKSQATKAAAPLAQTAKPEDDIKEGEDLRESSTDGPSTSNQPVTTKTQGQAAQPANSSDGRGENTDKKPVVGKHSERAVENATGKLAKEVSADRSPG